jgi:glycosyltransferase involved in cell wall biosynthesis
MVRVGLVMIVKNEEHVIERAIKSAIPFISTYVIVDTGSTDSTKEKITKLFADAGISGSLVDRPWVNFGHNRSEALALCDGKMDWAIMLDADDNLAGTVPPANFWEVTAAPYDVLIVTLHHGTLVHRRHQIFKTGIGWCYEGALHECAICKGKEKVIAGVLPPETYMETRCEGARSKDPEKYKKDALLLLKQWEEQPTNYRTLHYLAQSYRDAGDKENAIKYYREYLASPSKNQNERYGSILSLITLVNDADEEMRLAWTSIDVCKDRLEAPFSAIVKWRERNLPVTHQLFALANYVKTRKINSSYNILNTKVYEWGMDFQLGSIAFELGYYKEAYEASVRTMLHGPAAEESGKNAKLALSMLEK